MPLWLGNSKLSFATTVTSSSDPPWLLSLAHYCSNLFCVTLSSKPLLATTAAPHRHPQRTTFKDIQAVEEASTLSVHNNNITTPQTSTVETGWVENKPHLNSLCSVGCSNPLIHPTMDRAPRQLACCSSI